jgi:hypothetical protein
MTTQVGDANRDIEKSLKLVMLGSRGATRDALLAAKKRQLLLTARAFKSSKTT